MSENRQLAIELLLAIAIVLAALAARRSRTGVLVLVVLCAVFPLADQAWEGGTLLALGHQHGVTVADLLAVSGFGWAAWLLIRSAHRPD